MPYQSDAHPTTLFRPIPLITIYAFGSLSAVAVTLRLRLVNRPARTLECRLCLAVIAMVCFVRFLVRR